MLDITCDISAHREGGKVNFKVQTYIEYTLHIFYKKTVYKKVVLDLRNIWKHI